MPKVSEPTFAKLPSEAMPLPLRDRDEISLGAIFSLLFDLKRSEERALAKLAMHDYSSKTDLHAAVRDIARGSMDTFICVLRRKLARHNIEIVCVSKIGYGLRLSAREKICKLLAKHDAAVIRAVKTETPERVSA